MDELEAACNALLDVALNTQVGATAIPEDRYLSKLKYAEQIKIWRQHEARLKAEIAEYQTALLKEGYENAILKRPDEELVIPYQELEDQVWTPEKILEYDDRFQEIIVKHQDDLFKESNKNQRDELILHRIISTPIIIDSLYPPETVDGVPPSPTHPLMPLIKDAQLARDAAMPALVDLAAQLTRTHEEIDKVRAENDQLRNENREMWETLQQQAQKKADGEEEEEREHEKFKERKRQTAILRSVFQALIVESGTNWAKDPALREFMTS